MTGPLAGYRVLDLSIWQQGTYATAMLADMGADVIKIESYTNPDPGRGLGAPDPGSPRRAYFDALNRGKRSITLDLKTDAGLEVFWWLVGRSDVFHNNLRGGAMERLGITYESLCAHNPLIIYSTASGWGHLGPDRHVGAMDTLAQARGGFMAANTLPSGEPQASSFPQADHVGAIVSGYSIVLALLHRERSGEGQEVNTSLYGSQLCIQSFSITSALWTGVTPPPRPREDRPATWTHFQAGDGKWFMIGALPADKWWAQFCEVMGSGELAAEPYASAPERALRNREVIAKMDAIFASKPRAEWLRLFHARDLLVQPVADYLEIGADEQAWANDYLVKVADDEGGEWPIVGSPVHLSKSPAQLRSLGPVFGAHTEEVLLETGFSWPEIEALRERGAFGSPT